MKFSLALCLGVAAISLPTTLFALDSVGSSDPTVTAQGSTISSGGYTFSTASDLILGATAIAEGHGLYSDNTYNPGWTGDGGPMGTYSANNPADDPTGDAVALSYLTDGSYGGDVPSHGNFASAGDPSAGAGYTATYSLGTNPLGYQLTDIEVYSGWSDAGRYQQAYTIQYSLVTAPTTFLTLTTVSPYPGSTGGDTGAMTKLTPTAGAYLVGGVPMADVRINFNAVANGWTGYREFVVNGVVAPEPSTYALILVGGAVLAFTLRRRSQANG